MTLTARTFSSRNGFTLIEIVMVITITAMLLGGAVAYMVFSTDEHALRDASGKIELLAKRARTIAILQQTPYAIEFRTEGIRLLPFAEAGQDEKRTAGGHRIGGERVEMPSAGAKTPVRDQLNLDPKMTPLIRRWSTEDWLPMGDHIIHVWRFDPDGLCEPLGVRVAIGKSYIEDVYHPLTAAIRDTTMELK